MALVNPNERPQSTLTAYTCLTLSMALVGLYIGLSPLLVAVFPVLLLAWMRFALAALAMGGWLRRRPEDAVLTAAEHGLLFLQSLLGNFLFTLCALHGAAMAGALSAGVVMAGIPACVALLSRVFLREPLNARIWAATLCTAIAVALLALQRHAPEMDVDLHAARDIPSATGPSGDSRAALGHLLLLAAVICEASYVVIGKRLSSRVSPRRVSALINLWGLALATPMGLWMALDFDFAAVTISAWALLGFYAWAASVLTVWLWMKGLQQVPAQKAGIFTVFLPLSSAAVGVGLLGEPWSGTHALALCLALSAVYLVTRPSPRPQEKPWTPPVGPHGPA
ncbi:MAG: DMT family transporter [Burkholderiaceae bacterium]|jgi:drug/metabolite transporter (DMT)-like permease